MRLIDGDVQIAEGNASNGTINGFVKVTWGDKLYYEEWEKGVPKGFSFEVGEKEMILKWVVDQNVAPWVCKIILSEKNKKPKGFIFDGDKVIEFKTWGDGTLKT